MSIRGIAHGVGYPIMSYQEYPILSCCGGGGGTQSYPDMRDSSPLLPRTPNHVLDREYPSPVLTGGYLMVPHTLNLFTPLGTGVTHGMGYYDEVTWDQWNHYGMWYPLPEITWDQWMEVLWNRDGVPRRCEQTVTCENITFPILRLSANRLQGNRSN